MTQNNTNPNIDWMNTTLRRVNLIGQPLVVLIAIYTSITYYPGDILLGLPWLLVAAYALMMSLDAVEDELRERGNSY